MNFPELAVSALKKNKCNIALISENGKGKSSSLIETVRQLLSDTKTNDGRVLIPVYIPLKCCRIERDGHFAIRRYFVINFVGGVLSNSSDSDYDQIEDILFRNENSGYRFALFLDGADENTFRSSFAEEIEYLAALVNVSVVFASSVFIFGEKSPNKWQKYSILPISDEIKKQYASSVLTPQMSELLSSPFYLSCFHELKKICTPSLFGKYDLINQYIEKSMIPRVCSLFAQGGNADAWKILYNILSAAVNYWLPGVCTLMADENTFEFDCTKTSYREYFAMHPLLKEIDMYKFCRDVLVPMGLFCGSELPSVFTLSQTLYRDYFEAVFIKRYLADNPGILSRNIPKEAMSFFVSSFEDRNECLSYLHNCNREISLDEELKKNPIVNSNIVRLFAESGDIIENEDFSSRKLEQSDFSNFVRISNTDFSDSFFSSRSFFLSHNRIFLPSESISISPIERSDCLVLISEYNLLLFDARGGNASIEYRREFSSKCLFTGFAKEDGIVLFSSCSGSDKIYAYETKSKKEYCYDLNVLFGADTVFSSDSILASDNFLIFAADNNVYALDYNDIENPIAKGIHAFSPNSRIALWNALILIFREDNTLMVTDLEKGTNSYRNVFSFFSEETDADFDLKDIVIDSSDPYQLCFAYRHDIYFSGKRMNLRLPSNEKIVALKSADSGQRLLIASLGNDGYHFFSMKCTTGEIKKSAFRPVNPTSFDFVFHSGIAYVRSENTLYDIDGEYLESICPCNDVRSVAPLNSVLAILAGKELLFADHRQNILCSFRFEKPPRFFFGEKPGISVKYDDAETKYIEFSPSCDAIASVEKGEIKSGEYFLSKDRLWCSPLGMPGYAILYSDRNAKCTFAEVYGSNRELVYKQKLPELVFADSEDVVQNPAIYVNGNLFIKLKERKLAVINERRATSLKFDFDWKAWDVDEKSESVIFVNVLPEMTDNASSSIEVEVFSGNIDFKKGNIGRIRKKIVSVPLKFGKRGILRVAKLYEKNLCLAFENELAVLRLPVFQIVGVFSYSGVDLSGSIFGRPLGLRPEEIEVLRQYGAKIDE